MYYMIGMDPDYTRYSNSIYFNNTYVCIRHRGEKNEKKPTSLI